MKFESPGKEQKNNPDAWTNTEWSQYLQRLRERLGNEIAQVRKEGIPKTRQDEFTDNENSAAAKRFKEASAARPEEGEVANLEMALRMKYNSGGFRLAEQIPLEVMMPEIERGEYTHIIGVDASGRPSALLAWKAINIFYDEKHLPHADIIFLPGFSGKYEVTTNESRKILSDMTQYLTEKYDLQGKRVLVVDDTLLRGNAVALICEALKKVGARFDLIAGAGYRGDDEIRNFKRRLRAKKIAIGDEGVSDIYNAKEEGANYSGVVTRRGKTPVLDEDQKYGRHFRKYSNLAAIELLITAVKKWRELD